MDRKFEEFYFSYTPKTIEEEKVYSEMFKQYSKLRNEFSEQRLKMNVLSNSKMNLSGVVKLHRDTINNLTNRNRCLESTNRQLKVELREANMRITKMTNQVKNLEQTNLRLLDDLESKTEEVNNMRERVQDLATVNIKSTADIKSLENQIKTMDAVIKDTDDHVHRLMSQINEAQLKLTESLRDESTTSTDCRSESQMPCISTADEDDIEDLEDFTVEFNSNNSPQQITSEYHELSPKFADQSITGELNHVKWNPNDENILCVIYKVKTSKESQPNGISSLISKFWKKKTSKAHFDSTVDYTKCYQVVSKDFVIKFCDPNFGGCKGQILKKIAKISVNSMNPYTKKRKFYLF